MSGFLPSPLPLGRSKAAAGLDQPNALKMNGSRGLNPGSASSVRGGVRETFFFCILHIVLFALYAKIKICILYRVHTNSNAGDLLLNASNTILITNAGKDPLLLSCCAQRTPPTRGRPRGSARCMLGPALPEGLRRGRASPPRPLTCGSSRLISSTSFSASSAQPTACSKSTCSSTWKRSRGASVSAASAFAWLRSPGRPGPRPEPRPKPWPPPRRQPATTPHHGARSWLGSHCGEWVLARRTRLRRPRPCVFGQSEAGDCTFPQLRRGSAGVVRPAGRGRECGLAGLLRPPLRLGCRGRAGRRGLCRPQNGLERRFSG